MSEHDQLREDYDRLLKRVGEQVAAIGRLKGQQDAAKTTKPCPRCANLEAVLRSIRQSLSRRLDTAHFHSSEHGETFCDALAMVNDYMTAVGVEPLQEVTKKEAPDVAI